MKSAHKCVVHLVAEECVTQIVVARPSPHVLGGAGVLRMLKHDDADQPDDHAEDKPAAGEERVVDADLFGPLVAAARIADKDHDADEERKARGGENEALRYDAGVWCPGRQAVLGLQVFSSVEDGQGR